MILCNTPWLFFVFVCVIQGAPEGEDLKELSSERSRDLSDFKDEDWKLVQSHDSINAPPSQDENSSAMEQLQESFPKRRRLRKRRRRPAFAASNESNEDRIFPRRRLIKPQRLEQLPEPWEEMADESMRRPYNRRRLTPIYESFEEQEQDSLPYENVQPPQPPQPLKFVDQQVNYEKVRDPFTALQEVENKQKSQEENVVIVTPETTTTPPDLKTLLKQSGGSLSLSEILQQKNISLAELLKGDQHAIKALTEKPESNTEVIVEYKNPVENDTKYKRLPPSLALRKKLNKNYASESAASKETLSPKETLDAQRRRLAVLGGKETKTYSGVTKYDVITEPTTEKRIFVPSHPKLYTSYDFKPAFIAIKEESTQYIPETTTPVYEEPEVQNTTQETTTVKQIVSTIPYILNTKPKEYTVNRISMKPQFKSRLPITSAKMHKMTSKAPPKNTPYSLPSTLPFKPIKIDINDLYGITDIKKEVTVVREDKPLKMSIDLDDIMKKSDKIDDVKGNLVGSENYPVNRIIKLPDFKLTTDKPSPQKLKPITAKDELMEILRDPISREKLARILDNRNMTLQELVDQRERGSSQLHLADIFHNQTREPEPKEEPAIGHINMRDFNPYAIFGRKQKSSSLPLDIKKDSRASSYYTSVIDIKPVEENADRGALQSKDVYTVTSFPTYKFELDKNTKDINQHTFFPVWRNIYPSIYTDLYESNYKKANLDNYEIQNLDRNSLQRLDDVENRISEAVNEKLNVNLIESKYEEDDEEGVRLPYGVRSAIVASFVIVGISIIMFLTILVIFKWSQKRKQRLCYSGSFSGSRIKSPILETEPKRTIRTFMTETLGRTKQYNKSYLQRISESMWENDRKPFQ